MHRIAIIISLLCMSILRAGAQGVSVEQKIDSLGIFIGQQAHMTVDVTAPENAKVVFPQWKPSTYLVPGVELLAIEGDTTRLSDGQKRVSQRLTITSFDENLYPIPPVEVKVDGKAYKGSSRRRMCRTILSCGASGVGCSGSVCSWSC